MNQVHYQRRARRPMPEFGIELGQSYYWWRVMVDGQHHTLASRHRPSRQEMEEMKQDLRNGNGEAD